MAKQRSVFTCQQCGYQTPRWLGRCPDCGEWDSLVEETVVPTPAGGPTRRATASQAKPQPLAGVRPPAQPRLATGIGELDRVLGGGLVGGSAVLVGGDPGIGKSTLLLQACHGVSLQGLQALYVTGEESLVQLKLRAERLGLRADGLLVLAESDAEALAAPIQNAHPDFAVVDWSM